MKHSLLSHLHVLGTYATDKVTGFGGVISNIVQQNNGNIQYTLQPKSDDPTKFIDPLSIDYHTLELDEAHPNNITVYQPDEINVPDISFGSTMVDTFSGFQGRVDRMVVYINGCTQVRLVPTYNAANASLTGNEPQYFDATKLDVVATEQKGKTPADVAPPKPTGGPCERVPRF